MSKSKKDNDDKSVEIETVNAAEEEEVKASEEEASKKKASKKKASEEEVSSEEKVSSEDTEEAGSGALVEELLYKVESLSKELGKAKARARKAEMDAGQAKLDATKAETEKTKAESKKESADNRSALRKFGDGMNHLAGTKTARAVGATLLVGASVFVGRETAELGRKALFG